MRTTGPVLGCIADDFTGAVDVAAGVSLTGLRTVVVASDEHGAVGELGELGGRADVVVIALKSRTNPVSDAVEQSLRAADQLLAVGAQTLFFKYCSTFDSTPSGNIGPVADALVDLLDAPIALVAPAYPGQRRTVVDGQLFVGELLLADSAMRTHPLTPMTSSDVAGLLAEQSRYPVGRVSLGAVRGSGAALTTALDELVATGHRYAVADTISTADVRAIARAVRSHRLVTGGAALVHALAELAAREAQVASGSREVVPAGEIWGRQIVLSGSCSLASQLQVAHFSGFGAVLQLDPRLLEDAGWQAEQALDWAQEHRGPILISTTVGAAELAAIQRELGREVAAARVEDFFRAVGARLVARGFGQILVAGGETSGVVTAALGVREMVVGTPIGTGLAWCTSRQPPVALALKSGNFGDPAVFTRAFELLQHSSSATRSSSGGTGP